MTRATARCSPVVRIKLLRPDALVLSLAAFPSFRYPLRRKRQAMPRFLDVVTGRFHWVEDPRKVAYAILSHTWRSEDEGGEQTYAEIVELQRRHGIGPKPRAHDTVRDAHDANDSPSNPEHAYPLFTFDDPHPFFSDFAGLSEKTRGFCRVAREAGYELVWFDSGCIDKSSSAELAEAINSMFALYRHADVCFAYLVDVSDGKDVQNRYSEFYSSRWHLRGWTLQELLAPKRVLFLDKQWRFLGTKFGLATTIQKITRIDFAILTGKSSISSASVARRMSWASNRKTTRVEDEAYSLLGIFGVHLSPIYGEGRNAFLRLQEEIIKYIPDQSIFAWGNRGSFLGTPGPDMRAKRLLSVQSDLPSWLSRPGHGLLAPSPFPFNTSGDIVPLTRTEFASSLRDFGLPDGNLPSLHCVVSPEGIRLSFLTLTRRGGPWHPSSVESAHLLENGCDFGGSVVSFALLSCAQPRAGTHLRSLIALILFRPSSEADQNGGLFVTSSRIRHSWTCTSEEMSPARFAILTPDDAMMIRANHDIILQVAETVVLRSSADVVPETPGLFVPLGWSVNLWKSPTRQNDPPLADFLFTRYSCEGLRVLGFGLTPLECHRSDDLADSEIILTSSLTMAVPETIAGTGSQYVPIVKIQVHLTENPGSARMPHNRRRNTTALFYLSKTGNPIPLTSNGTSGPVGVWKHYPEIPFDGGTRMYAKTFNTEEIDPMTEGGWVLATVELAMMFKEERVSKVRDLRVTLKTPRPPGIDWKPASEARFFSYLLFDVEVSATYRSEETIVLHQSNKSNDLGPSDLSSASSDRAHSEPEARAGPSGRHTPVHQRPKKRRRKMKASHQDK